MHYYDADENEFRVAAALGGETDRPGSRVGEWVRAGPADEDPIVVVGGYYGSGVGLDTGAVYVMDLR